MADLYQKEIDLVQHALNVGVTPAQIKAIFNKCVGTELCNPTGHGSREHCHDCGKQ